MSEIFKPIEIKYRVEVLDKGRRKRKIKKNLSKKILRKHPVPIKGKNVDCKVVLLPIGVPVYHLNNGRTRSAQRSHIIRNNHKDNYFKDSLENNKQQIIQHKILVGLAQSTKSNIFAELKRKAEFRDDSPLLLDSNGVVINGNRRLSSIRELFESDPKKFHKFKHVPCAIIEQHLDGKQVKQIENNIQVRKEYKQDYDWISLALEVKEEKEVLGVPFSQIAADMGRTESNIKDWYGLISLVDKCLIEDYKDEGNYDLVKNQEQIWKNTIERANKQGVKPAEKDALFKFARMVSLNSGKFGDRDYSINNALQKKGSLIDAVEFFKKHYKIKQSDNSIIDKDDPLADLKTKNTLDVSVVGKIPIKKNSSDLILKCIDYIANKKDTSAALKYSVSALGKLEAMNFMKYPENDRKQIEKNLNKIISKSEKIIDSKLKK